MAKYTQKSIEQMEAERRELARQIKARKRAEAKAAKEALLSERQALGVAVAEAVGADTIEAVQRLHQALLAGQVQAHLRQQIGAASSDGQSGGGQDAHHRE